MRETHNLRLGLSMSRPLPPSGQSFHLSVCALRNACI